MKRCQTGCEAGARSPLEAAAGRSAKHVPAELQRERRPWFDNVHKRAAVGQVDAEVVIGYARSLQRRVAVGLESDALLLAFASEGGLRAGRQRVGNGANLLKPSLIPSQRRNHDKGAERKQKR